MFRILGLQLIPFLAASLTIAGQVIWEEFESGPDSFDLEGIQITFYPSSGTYLPMRTKLTDFPVSVNSGVVLDFTEVEDGLIQIPFPEGRQFPFFGEGEGSVTLDEVGRVVFGAATSGVEATTSAHFENRQISLLWSKLASSEGGVIRVHQEEKRFTVTWIGVPEMGSNEPNTAQLELFFDGRIRMSYLGVMLDEAVVGISSGGLTFDPGSDVETDFGLIDPIPLQLNAGDPLFVKAAIPGESDLFGDVIALSGNTLVVGAFREDGSLVAGIPNEMDNSAPDAGAVYVFVRDENGWTQQAYLKASNAEAGDFFGGALSISGDTLIVGARNEGSHAVGINADQNDNSAPRSGAVYVFVRENGVWSQEAYLKASNAESQDFFGISVSLDGDLLAVGASWEAGGTAGVGGDETDNSIPKAGAVYVFARENGVWSQEAYLKSSHPEDDRFGGSVALSGNLIAVGATSEDGGSTGVGGNPLDNSKSGAGAVYLFRKDAGIWAQEAYIKASNSDRGDRFGSSLDLEGTTLIVGSPQEAGGSTGVDGDEADNSKISSGAVYAGTSGTLFGGFWAVSLAVSWFEGFRGRI